MLAVVQVRLLCRVLRFFAARPLIVSRLDRCMKNTNEQPWRAGYQPNTANPPLPLETFGGCCTNEGELREANFFPDKTLRCPHPSNGQPGRPQSTGSSREIDAATWSQNRP